MLGIERLLEKIFNRQKVDKSERKSFEEEFNINTKYVHGLLFYNSYFDLLSKVLGKETICFIVGGWIRDRLLNITVEDSIDIDFIVTTSPVEIAKRFRSILGKGGVFQFEKDKEIATLIFEEGETRYRFDFSYLDIQDIINNPNLDFYDKEKAIIDRIEEDLRNRDFTINSMAIVFDDAVGLGATQTVLFDPNGGLEDLQNGVVKPISYENIKKDPVRILRGYRIAQRIDFELDKEFEKWILKNVDLLKQSPKERIRDEIFKIFDGKDSYKVLENLVKAKLIQIVIPEIEKFNNINKSGQLKTYLNYLKTIEKFLSNRDILSSFIDKRFLNSIGKTKFLAEFTDITMFKFSTLFHNLHFSSKDKNKFINTVNELFKGKISTDLVLGKKATDFIYKILINQGSIFELYNLKMTNNLPKEEINFFWYKNKDIAIYLFILSLSYAEIKLKRTDTENLKGFIKYLQSYYFEVYKREIIEELLLRGNEIMEILNIKPSKKIGILKDKLQEAQIKGSVKTKDEAIKFIQNIFSSELY